ncbi:MAG: DUF2892 domain-containing protein [Candidatus Margulisbacteria bacterium]|jgi:NhaP-type Na+/H+ or K+/H+ antiporter|nr:DUF2892 domain-containing protein [Candidatus Margulisiibacteriota bacterium]
MSDIKMNLSTFERFARIIIGGIFLLVASYVPVSDLLAWLLVIVGLILMLTGLAGWCPLYSLLKISSKKKGK